MVIGTLFYGDERYVLFSDELWQPEQREQYIEIHITEIDIYMMGNEK